MRTSIKLITTSAILVFLIGGATPAQTRGRTHDAFGEFVTKLPAADRVDIVEVRPLLTDDLKNADCLSRDLICAPDKFPYEAKQVHTLTRPEADTLLTLWRNLERRYLDRNDKCFYPDHVLRFYQGEVLLLETQVCISCRKITLPKLGIVSVGGSNKFSFFRFQSFLIPDASLHEQFEKFKREMMPTVGRQLTIIGLLTRGKGSLVEYGDGDIYINQVSLPRMNEIANLGCHTALRITGTLSFFEPPRDTSSNIRQIPPEHFYFNNPGIEVVRVEQKFGITRSKRRR